MWVRRNAQMVAGGVLLAGATLPLVALASGDAGAMDPMTYGSAGAAVTAALGIATMAVRALVQRSSHGPASTSTTTPGSASDHGERIAVLETRMQHREERDREHARLLDELRAALSEQSRAVDRAVAGNAEIIEAIRGLGANSGNGGGSEG